MDWTESLNEALRYIEAELFNGVDGGMAAKHVAMSRFYLEKAFSILTGMTISEYIRTRRLSLAAQELQAAKVRVIDLAYRCGYDTPESFSKAFTRFHGVSPSRARRPGVPLRCQNPLTIKITLEGAKVMDYKIEEMDAFCVYGLERTFHENTSFAEIPKFWGEFFAGGYQNAVCPMYGISLELSPEGGVFEYLIGDNCPKDKVVPEGMTKREIPAHTWAKFACTGPLPGSIQDMNRRIYGEWLPGNTEYEIAGSVNIEVYFEGDTSAADYRSEIWMPVKKKS